MSTPKIGGNFLMQCTCVGQQFRNRETMATFQRMLGQNARAETMDGEDGSEVDFFSGNAQAS